MHLIDDALLFAGIQLGVSQIQLVGKFRKQSYWHS